MPTLAILLLLVKATGLLLIALGASLALSRASAGSRHLVWLLALIGLLLIPALALWGPLPIRVLPATSRLGFTPAQPTAVHKADRSVVTLPALKPKAPTASVAPRSPEEGVLAEAADHRGPVVLLAWALGTLMLSLRLGWGVFSVRRIVRRGRPLEHPDWQTPLNEIADRLGLKVVPRLLRSDEVHMPFAAGLVYPTIVLPADSDGWSAERRSAVLIHELGHVRRRDLVGHTIGRVACALYWFHPLVWTAARRLRAESERACDDLALVFGTPPSDYAEHLLDIVTRVRDFSTPSVALAMAHRKEFEGRMLAILDPGLHRRSPSPVQTASIVGGLGGCRGRRRPGYGSRGSFHPAADAQAVGHLQSADQATGRWPSDTAGQDAAHRCEGLSTPGSSVGTLPLRRRPDRGASTGRRRRKRRRRVGARDDSLGNG
jgi:bla regulator protein blaR1